MNDSWEPVAIENGIQILA